MRRLILWLFILTLLVVVVGPLALIGVSLQPQSALPVGDILTPAQAAQSRAFVQRARAAARDTVGRAEVSASQKELTGLIATGARLIPSLRGRVNVQPDGMTAALSFQPPGLSSLGWVNAQVELGPSQGGIDLRAVRLGDIDLPPALALAVARTALDWTTSEDVGTLLLASVEEVRMQPRRLTIAADTGGAGDDSLFARAVGGIREAAGLTGGEAAKAHYEAMAAAAADGRLPSQGSAAPWLRFALDRAAEAGASGDLAARAEARAALLALAAHCGDRSAIETVAGAMAPEGRVTSACEGTTLGGRPDLRKHFTLSAAFAAAGGASVSFGLGEVKELVDAGRAGGSGFSFDDIAADRAGIAFAQQAMEAGRGGLGWMSGQLTSERAVMPSIAGLPSFMSEAEFEQRFGSVADERYLAQIKGIDARIAALPMMAR